MRFENIISRRDRLLFHDGQAIAALEHDRLVRTSGMNRGICS